MGSEMCIRDRIRPGDEILFCPCFDRWPSDVERPPLGAWKADLDYLGCIGAVTAQRKADVGLDYRKPFADDDEVRVVVLHPSAMAIASRKLVILLAASGDPYLALNDVLSWVAQLQQGMIETIVATMDGAWGGPVDLDMLDFTNAAIGWVD